MKRIFLVFFFLLSFSTAYPQLWEPVGKGFNGSPACLEIYNNLLFAGGNFTEVDEKNTSCLAFWNGLFWTSVNEPALLEYPGQVTAMTIYNNELYVVKQADVNKWGILKFNSLIWEKYAELSEDSISSVEDIHFYKDSLYIGIKYSTSKNYHEYSRLKVKTNQGFKHIYTTNGPIYDLDVYNDQLLFGGFFYDNNLHFYDIVEYSNGKLSKPKGNLFNSVSCINRFNNYIAVGGCASYLASEDAYITSASFNNGEEWIFLRPDSAFYFNGIENVNNILYGAGFYYNYDSKYNLTRKSHVLVYTGKWSSANLQPFDREVQNIKLYQGYIYVTGDFKKMDAVELNHIARMKAPVITILNSPPIANNDVATCQAESYTIIDVQVNDSDPNGDGFYTNILKHPKYGSAGVYFLDSISYVPDAGFIGKDTIQYSICDNNYGCDTAFVFINVTENLITFQANDDYATVYDTDTTFFNVKQNDYNPNNLSLSPDIIKMPANGIAWITNEKIAYKPDAGFKGADTLRYKICEGAICDSADVIIEVIEKPVFIPHLHAEEITIYPNPVHDRMYVTVRNALYTSLKVSLLNYLGQEVLATEAAGDENMDIQLPDLSPGTYLLKISLDDRKQFVRKVLIE